MSFKLKAVIAAIGLALASGHAAAANWQSPAASGGGDLFAIVYDSTSNDAYVLDLNTTFSQMAASGNTAGFSLSYNLGADSNYSSFISSATSADGGAPTLSYFIAGGNTTSDSYFLSDTKSPTGLNQTSIHTLNGALLNWQTGGIAQAIAAGGGSVATTPSNSYDPLISGEFTPNWDTHLPAGQTMAAGINNPLNWYQVSKTGSGLAAVTPVKYAGTWDLVSDASGTTLTYAVPAVPEPGTWALMAAGLLFVAGMARRRTSV